MRYICPKCAATCNHKIPKNIFVELHCSNCGHKWLDTQENHKPINVTTSDLLNAGADND